MILRRAAPGFSKPLIQRPILVLMVATTMVLVGLLTRVVPAPNAGAMRDLATSEKLAANLPSSRAYDKVHGRSTAGELRDASVPAPRMTGVTQPQTAFSEVFGVVSSTSNAQKRQIGMFILLLSTLSAVTLLTWRHYRRDYASPRRIGRRI